MILTIHMFQCVITVKLTGATQLERSICSFPAREIMCSQTPKPRILTNSNYLDQRIDVQLALRKHGYQRIIHGWEDESNQQVEWNKFLNRCDEVFGYLCPYISRDLLLHLEGLRTPREAWEKLDSLFNKQDGLRGYILENELVSLHPRISRLLINSLLNSSLQCSNANSAGQSKRMSRMSFPYSTNQALTILYLFPYFIPRGKYFLIGRFLPQILFPSPSSRSKTN